MPQLSPRLIAQVLFILFSVCLQFPSGKVCGGVAETCHQNDEQRSNGLTGQSTIA